MPDIRLTADEADRLPDVCMCCGEPATTFVNGSIYTDLMERVACQDLRIDGFVQEAPGNREVLAWCRTGVTGTSLFNRGI